MKTWKTKSGYKILQIMAGRSNVFLLTNGIKTILIDTSVSRTWNRLQKRLRKLDIKKIDLLFLTHSHFDHAANANRIKAKYNARVIIHKNESEYLRKGEIIVPKGTTFVTKSLVNFLNKFKSPSLIKIEPCEPDLIAYSFYDFKVIGFNAYLIHSPGHTAGSMSLIVDDEIAIVGDAMFGIFKNSIFPPFADDELLMIQSWGELLKTNCSYFLPSHGSVNSKALVEKEYDRRIKRHRRQVLYK